MVRLDPNQAHGSAALSRTFAHELGHALDARLATRDAAEAETFADRLSVALLAETPPPDLARARVLARNLDDTPALRVPMTLRGVPDPGLPSVLRFTTLLDREVDSA